MTSIYLIRHAQAAGNVGKRFQGQADHPLTETGRAQLAPLAARFRPIPVAAVYASPLQRARETASAIATSRGLSVRVEDDLIEMNLGAFENRSYDELLESHPEELGRFFEEPHLFRSVGGGEEFEAVLARMTRAITRLVERHPEETVLAVTHGCALRTLLCGLKRLPLARMPEIPWCPHGGSVHVIMIDGRPIFIGEADTTHLKEEFL